MRLRARDRWYVIDACRLAGAALASCRTRWEAEQALATLIGTPLGDGTKCLDIYSPVNDWRRRNGR